MRYDGPADRSTPCTDPACGGPTYTFPSGSVWCPAEDPHPGGRFSVRVAFERAPKTTTEAQDRAAGAPAPRKQRGISYNEDTGRSTKGTYAEVVKARAAKKKATGFDAGMDAFIGDNAD